ncbi:MAG: aminotransferase class I/II-fold pyridoxal phosphate-dependent enzyme [Anaerolineae bacterium]
MDVKSLFSPHIEGLETYEPPDWEVLPERLFRLDANENPFGPSPRVAEALARFDGYGLYPDYRALTEAVAEYAGTQPETIVLGNGGDEIIDLAVRLFVAPGEGTIVCPPAFGMYTVSTQAHRGRVLSVPRGDDFSLDVEGIEALLGAGAPGVRPKLLFVTSPGNPDGGAVPVETISRLLQLPLAVVVDEAYIEFGGESAVPLLAGHPNLIVLRTFSKWAGMAGLRLGYAVAAPEVTTAMHRLRPPYNGHRSRRPSTASSPSGSGCRPHWQPCRACSPSPARPTFSSAGSQGAPGASWPMHWPGKASWSAAFRIRAWPTRCGSPLAALTRTTRCWLLSSPFSTPNCQPPSSLRGRPRGAARPASSAARAKPRWLWTSRWTARVAMRSTPAWAFWITCWPRSLPTACST